MDGGGWEIIIVGWSQLSDITHAFSIWHISTQKNYSSKKDRALIFLKPRKRKRGLN